MHKFVQWVPEVRRYCPGLPVLLVGCKIDLRQDQRTIQELEKQSTKPISKQQVQKHTIYLLLSSIYAIQGQQVAQDISAYAYIECSAKLEQGVNEVFNSAIKSTMKKSSSCVIM